MIPWLLHQQKCPEWLETENFYAIGLDNKENILSHRMRSPEEEERQQRLILQLHIIIKDPAYFLFSFPSAILSMLPCPWLPCLMVTRWLPPPQASHCHTTIVHSSKIKKTNNNNNKKRETYISSLCPILRSRKNFPRSPQETVPHCSLARTEQYLCPNPSQARTRQPLLLPQYKP